MLATYKVLLAACLCLSLDEALCFQLISSPVSHLHHRSRAFRIQGPQGMRVGAPLERRSRRLSPVVMSGFDALRTELRGIIQAGIALGSLGTIGFLLAAGIRGGSKDVALNPANFVRWTRTVTSEEWQKLFWCLLLDAVGAFPEILLPGPTGEALDVVWAPLYAFLLFQTFGGRPFLYKSTLAACGFLEEIFPFTDIIPSATIGWFLESSSDGVRRQVIGEAERQLRKFDERKEETAQEDAR